MSRLKDLYWPALGVAVLVLVSLLLFANLGQMALTDRDEGEYGAAVAEMRRSGDWVVPTLNGNIYLEKPILSFWAIAGAEALVGRNELAARLPSAVSALLVVLLVAGAVWLAGGGLPAAVCAAGAAAFSPLFMLVGRACLTDMLLTLWVTLGLLAFWRACLAQPGRGLAWWLTAWAAMALSFLTKGPVGPAVMLPTALIYALAQHDLWGTIKRARIHWGVLIFIAVNLPWYGLVYMRLGDSLWRDFFVSQNLRRFSEVLLGHGGGFLYYLPVLLLGAFPVAVAALPELGRSLARNPLEQRRADPMAALRMLAAITVLVVLVVFSVAATKQINYILPALPFLGILAGWQLWRLAREEAPGRFGSAVLWGGLLGLGGLMALILAALPAGLFFAWPKILGSIRFDSSEYALPVEAPWVILWPVVMAALLALTVVGARWLWRRGRGVFVAAALILGAALCCAAMFLGLLPRVADEIQEPSKALVLAAVQKAGPDEMVSYGLWKPSDIYYADRVIPRLRVEQQAELAKALAADKPVWLLSRLSLIDKLADVPGFVAITENKGYLLGGNAAAKAKWQAGTIEGGGADTAEGGGGS